MWSLWGRKALVRGEQYRVSDLEDRQKEVGKEEREYE